MSVEEFKKQVLKCVIEDRPWDTTLVWGDAQHDFPELGERELDELVVGVLGGLLNDGLIYAHAAMDFGESYSREVAESEALPVEQVLAILSDEEGAKIHASVLVLHATDKGRRYYFGLPERITRSNSETSSPPHSED